MADEIILISISGRDKPGLMAELMELIVEADANVLDMGQAVIHDELALGILVQVPELGTLTDDITAQCHKVEGKPTEVHQGECCHHGNWNRNCNN